MVAFCVADLALAAFAHHLPGARIDIDEDHATIADELQAIDHGRGIVFRAEVLHSGLGGQHAAFDIAQGPHVARAQIAAGFVLLIRTLLLCGGRSGKNGERGSYKGGQSVHDAGMPRLRALNKR